MWQCNSNGLTWLCCWQIRETPRSCRLNFLYGFILLSCTFTPVIYSNLILINVCLGGPSIWRIYCWLGYASSDNGYITVSLGFPAQVCNSQGGRGRGFITLGRLLQILCDICFLYIVRDCWYTHLRVNNTPWPPIQGLILQCCYYSPIPLSPPNYLNNRAPDSLSVKANLRIAAQSAL